MLQGVVHQDAAGTVIAMNPAAESILGKACDEFIGKNSVAVEQHTIRENGERFPGMEHPAMVALQSGKSVGAVVMGVFNPKQDDFRWISVGAVPVFPSGEVRPSEVYSVFEDITERRRTEENYSSLFREMLDGFALHEIICDTEGRPTDYRFLAVNPAFEQMTSLKGEEIVGRTVREVLPGTEQTWIEKYGSVAMTGEPIFFESYTATLNKYFEVKAFRPAPNRFACIFLDVTERRRAERERQALEQQLLQAQKMESLGVLAGGVAHNFNNILQVIMGGCSLVRLDTGKTEYYLAEIEKASERAAVLCRQMLEYAGESQAGENQLDFAALVTDTVEMLKASLPQNADITLFCLPEIPAIKGDANQLGQIVLNLVINASEAIGEKHGSIRVLLSTMEITAARPVMDHQGKAIRAGRYVCLEVTDSGCGMNEEARSRIFEPFYTTKFTGRGLGVPAILGIVTAHGGAVQLASRVGKGTTFKIYLPVHNGQTVGTGATRSVTPADWQGSGTVLLVEDEEQIKEMAKAMVQGFGFTVLDASNGKEALELYLQNAANISMVITDIGMSTMDGYTLIRELKKLEPALPIIISSGFGDDAVTSKIPRNEIAGLISKPYHLATLRKVLQSVVGTMPR
jgi:PAS domain S-box-containing protein